MVYTDRQDIANFLTKFKDIISHSRGLDVVPRAENNKSLIELGLTMKNRKDEILSLVVNDYCEGPIPDKDRPDDLWIFGKKINGQEVYIKLKIVKISGEMIAKCISFHLAGFPLHYPCRVPKGVN